MGISIPSSKPSSTLTPTPLGGTYFINFPISGKKLFFGSSAYTLISIEWPLIFKSSWLNDNFSPLGY